MFTSHETQVLLLSSAVLLAILLDYVRGPKRKPKLTRAQIVRAIEKMLEDN